MPRQSKSKTDVAETTTAATVNAPVETAAAAPVKVKKEPKAKVVTETSTVAPVETSTVAPTDVDVDVADLTTQSTEFLAKLNQLGSLIASLKIEYRSLEKKWTREIKTAQKQTNRRKRKAGNRAPSGFVKPTKISDELASFLGKTKGTEMARTDVTREINTYIRENKLQDSSNGRKINPDKKLATLLKLKTTDELTYFNLQKYMSPHFAKSVKAEVAATTTA